MYEINDSNGRLELREDARKSIIRSKELLAIRDGQWLAALPTASGERTFVWFEGPDTAPEYLQSAAEVLDHPHAADLLLALRKRYPGEV